MFARFWDGISGYFGRFLDGMLGYVIRGIRVDDIGELQLFINSYLGQKVYRAKYVGYVDVYARNESEAREFVEYMNVRTVLSGVELTNLDRI